MIISAALTHQDVTWGNADLAGSGLRILVASLSFPGAGSRVKDGNGFVSASKSAL